jgi:hypothetical protein
MASAEIGSAQVQKVKKEESRVARLTRSRREEEKTHLYIHDSIVLYLVTLYCRSIEIETSSIPSHLVVVFVFRKSVVLPSGLSLLPCIFVALR